MSNAFDEIDALLRRVNKLYIAYSFISLSVSSYLISYTKYSKRVRIVSVFGLTLIMSGTLTWIHVFNTFSPAEITYLNVGLDKTYPSIKSSRNKHK